MTVDLICPYCKFSKNVPKENIPVGTKRVTCPQCHQGFEFYPKDRDFEFMTEEAWFDAGHQKNDQESEKGYQRHGTPWENRSELGLWQGIFQTLKAVLFYPETLFRSLTFNGGIREPLAFGLLVCSIGSMFGFFWQFLTLSEGVSSILQSVFGQVAVGLFFFIIILIVPIFVILFLFVYSGILHILLLIVRGGKNGYEATFRVVFYSQAAQVWSLIPFVGGFIGGIWQLIIQIIGLRVIHETSYLRIFLAFLLPVAFVFLLIIGVSSLIFTRIFL